MINVKIVLLICQLKVFEIFVDVLDIRLQEKNKNASTKFGTRYSDHGTKKIQKIFIWVW